MDPPFDMLLEVKKDLINNTNNTNLLAKALKKVNDLKAKNISQEAYIVLMMSFLMAEDLGDDFFEHLQYVTASYDHAETVKAAASEILRQKTLWTDELMNKEKH